MRSMTAALCAAILSCSAVKAAEFHVSHFGQVMASVVWALALEQDLFRKNGVDVTDVISSQGGGTTLRNMLAGGIPFADAAAGVAAIDSGAVDATYLLEPLLSKYGDKYRVIGRVSDVLPKVAPQMLIASQELVDKEPAKLRALLLTHKQAVDFIYADPKAATRLAIKRMVNIDESSLLPAVERMAQARYFSDGNFDPEALEGTRRLLEATGDIKGAFDFDAIIDRRFLPK